MERSKLWNTDPDSGSLYGADKYLCTNRVSAVKPSLSVMRNLIVTLLYTQQPTPGKRGFVKTPHFHFTL